MLRAIVIPARLEAQRLPRKPLVELGGEPLIARVWRRAKASKVADRVVVATDAEDVARVIRERGGEAILTRASHPSGTDRVAEAAAAIGADEVVNLQGDEPFFPPERLDDLFARLSTDDVDWVTLATPLASEEERADPNVVKVVTAGDRALYFSRAPIPHCRDGAGGEVPGLRHIGVYGYRREALERFVRAPPHPLERCERLEQLRALAIGLRIVVVPCESFERGIDTPQDLERARRHIAARPRGEGSVQRR